MARTWRELFDRMPPESQEHILARAEQLDTLLTLRELVRERKLTQEELAERLDVAQGNVSRTLRRSDPHLSTLRAVVEAMGGELELVAHFPDRDYAITAEE